MKYYGTEISIENNNNVFGDGEHESTLIVLEALHRQNLKNKSVLDIGTGTGIQSIFAKKWGAKSILAVDVDVMAIETARKNFEENKVEVDSVLNIYNEKLNFKADITVANLPPHNIVEFIPMAKDTMKKNGIVIFSWYSTFNAENEVDLGNYEVIDIVKGVNWDAYIIKQK